MDRRVPRDPATVSLEDAIGLGRQPRVLEPHAWESLDDASVQVGVGRLAKVAAEDALEVDDVGAAEAGELRDEVVAPGLGCVELEARLRVELDERTERTGRGLLAQSLRDHVANRARRPPERLAERLMRLPKRQVERRALVAPAAVVDLVLRAGL